jgi:hypothetical protein
MEQFMIITKGSLKEQMPDDARLSSMDGQVSSAPGEGYGNNQGQG